jgi:hypothetical protein
MEVGKYTYGHKEINVMSWESESKLIAFKLKAL